MDNEIKRSRRMPKTVINETNQSIESQFDENISNEFNSFASQSSLELDDSIYGYGLFDYFSKEQIDNVLLDPISNHDVAIKLSNFIYSKNGIVSNSIDYMVAMPCLDRIVSSKSKNNGDKVKRNKELMISTLEKIDDKSFIRDSLHSRMNNGICFYYFETTKKAVDRQRFMNDYEVEQIVEINDLGINASIITLPWEYTKIVGKKNGRYVIAFNLRYFDDWTGESLTKKLRKYPQEIRHAYEEYSKNNTGGSWVTLDNDKTICRKIKCKDVEPWGRPLSICALDDILYRDSFVDTKRKTLNEINNKVIYQTLPEGKEKGTCALTKTQQEDQHLKVKQAVMNKNNRGGTSFFTVAAGTKLDSINVSTEIFDEKNESDLNNQISLDLGVCASLLGSMTGGGNYANQQSNLEMITSQLYAWIYDIQKDLNHVINKNIIQDEKNRVEVYYFPTTFVNKKDFFEQMSDLYLTAGGSLRFYIAASGVDPDIYLSVLDEEIELGMFEKYKPHQTSHTLSKNSGRPEDNNSNNPNTIQSKTNNSNNQPKPSTS